MPHAIQLFGKSYVNRTPRFDNLLILLWIFEFLLPYRYLESYVHILRDPSRTRLISEDRRSTITFSGPLSSSIYMEIHQSFKHFSREWLMLGLWIAYDAFTCISINKPILSLVYAIPGVFLWNICMWPAIWVVSNQLTKNCRLNTFKFLG